MFSAMFKKAKSQDFPVECRAMYYFAKGRHAHQELMNFLKQVIKDGLKYLAAMTVVILCACILGIPIFIGIMINSVPLFLFGILFLSAFISAFAIAAINALVDL